MGYTNVATTSNESVINLACFLICTLFLGKASAPSRNKSEKECVYVSTGELCVQSSGNAMQSS